MKITRLQRNLVLLSLFNVLVIGFLALKPMVMDNDYDERIVIQDLTDELLELESRSLDLVDVMIDTDKEQGVRESNQKALKYCLYEKLENIGDRKIRKKELKLIFDRCFLELEIKQKKMLM